MCKIVLFRIIHVRNKVTKLFITLLLRGFEVSRDKKVFGKPILFYVKVYFSELKVFFANLFSKDSSVSVLTIYFHHLGGCVRQIKRQNTASFPERYTQQGFRNGVDMSVGHKMVINCIKITKLTFSWENSVGDMGEGAGEKPIFFGRQFFPY